jgi:hypothetical protein
MRRPVLIAALVAVLVIAVAIGGYEAWQAAKSHFRSDSCSVTGYTVDTDQAAVASAMVGAVTKFPVKLPERASVLAIAAALQESKLTNIPPGQGDRDSVGVLQQRPSQGWGHGKAAPLTNVTEATTEFLEHLIDVPNWPTLPLAKAVQAVQISADGSLYSQHEPEAQALADALQGTKPAGISCSFDKPTQVAAPSVVATQARTQLGLTTPVAAGSTVRVPGAHWQTAAWFVANANRLGIDRVDYDGRSWTRAKGWQTAAASSPTVVVATMYQKAN